MHLKILGGNTAHVDHRRGHNKTKMYSAYEKFISGVKSYFGPLQGHVLIYTKVSLGCCAKIPGFLGTC